MSIYCSSELIKRFEEISDLGFEPNWTTGTRVARGFADLGFEEFLFIEPNKLVSLFTGDRSEVSLAERSHFIVIPTVDYIADFILEQGVDIKRVECIDGREWEVHLGSDDETNLFRSPGLWDTFSKALLFILSGAN